MHYYTTTHKQIKSNNIEDLLCLASQQIHKVAREQAVNQHPAGIAHYPTSSAVSFRGTTTFEQKLRSGRTQVTSV